MNPWVELRVSGSGIGFEKQVSPRRGPNCEMAAEGDLMTDELLEATGWMGRLSLLVETSAWR
jgi:hypothetical protein